MNKYDIYSLIETFERHAKEFEKTQKKLQEKYPEREKIQNDFNICYAFLTFAKEIKELKEKTCKDPRRYNDMC